MIRFLNPVLINETFAKFYNFNSTYILINENSNFNVAKNKVINLENKTYK